MLLNMEFVTIRAYEVVFFKSFLCYCLFIHSIIKIIVVVTCINAIIVVIPAITYHYVTRNRKE